MKVRAATLREMGLPAPYAQSQPLQIGEVTLDGPGPGELLVRVRAAGLCHSDLSVIDGSRPRVMPMVLGHEAAGEVVETGPDTPGFMPGDAVVFAFVPSCGHCDYCADGRAALCEPGAKANTAGTLLSGARRWHAADGGELHHHLGVSGFAEYTVVSARSAVRIDRDLPPQIAALFGCAVMTGVGAVINTARVVPGESVAIFGMGGVGLAALLGAVAAGADPIVAVDVLPAKLELARSLGATHTVLAGPDAVNEIREATRGGAAYAIETAGVEIALAQAYAATRRGGTTVTVGLPHPQKQFAISAVSLVAEERTVKGSYMGSAVPSRDLPRFIALYRAGRMPVDRLLTQTLKLEDINAAFDRLARGEAVRQVVLFE
ncbi:zinc-dependent alcohol dehydrogenase family protein [Sinimarinibacterium flocculans]|uniref:Alcohol dehydrogenase n=1 Tax=Sinimarinibacterium flocculans TaxID=985250 RepID=A0A318E5H4_9GAMM|nr:zinc-dependent alcohol dehydrogenase family protein [Sinimarinibacterium flocculans]MEC9361918.1 zinc-dependent alcohol dehydrogenase family protein [Pseudomonadota bacterium]PXV63954.1 alcohol dehydrogenase [Sinimarinibacterium flocculans]